MDKKKVKVHIENVSKILGTKRQTLSAGNLEHLQNELKLALIELSKSDWVSVKDGLPPYDESVLVTNKETPEIVLKTSRTKGNGRNTDNNGFLCAIAFTITHWKPIEKLEERV